MSKKKPLFELTCEYCKFYHLHICNAFGEQVKGSSSACNNFEMAGKFWCDKNSYQMSIAACLNSQDHKLFWMCPLFTGERCAKAYEPKAVIAF